MLKLSGLKTSFISHRTSANFVILIFILAICCTGCFSRFTQTKRQIREYYADQPVKPTYFTIQNDSVKLFCAVAGADTLPPLLIIHGAPGAWYGSRNILADTMITNRFQVISVDRPGYDKSTFKASRKTVTSISLQASIIYEAMRLNRSFKKGIVMGSSYGGPIAVNVAIDHPESFYRVLLLAAAIDPDKEKFWWFNKYVHHGPIKWMIPRFFRTATNEKYTHVKELRKLEPLWSKLAVPVTALQGDADHIVSPANLDFAKKMLAGKDATFISLPGVDHLIRWQRADLVKEIILNTPSPSPRAEH
ncbi:MAG TPA: alpha/beta hydrolase [Chitinophagaceae bacterium]|nr:alpha/beta hydrolase [Chitinophagaceae bacterium]